LKEVVEAVKHLTNQLFQKELVYNLEIMYILSLGRRSLYYQDPGSVKYLVFLILSVPLSGV
jgi:hypothetical protein